MDMTSFRASLSVGEPPVGLSAPLLTLWWDAKGEWNKAHEHAQSDESKDGAAVHAYLHRVEGDLRNAGYWYNRAQRTPRTDPLATEWEALAREMLTR